jgi:orotate phosphoribosyltransferase-like protein
MTTLVDRILGRIFGFGNLIIESAKSLREKGLSFRKIGKELGVDEGTIRKRIKN